jgi:imidazolonepropionase-like amidohydrolase
LHAAVHEAHHFHKLTAAHCRAKESMIRVVEAGIDLMEHAEFLDPANQLRFDSDLAEKMAKSAIWISPTLQAWTDYPRIGSLTQRREEGQFLQEEKQELARLEHRLDIMRKMLDYGMKDRLVAGTDSGVSNLACRHLDCDFQLLENIRFFTGRNPDFGDAYIR